MRNNIKLLPHTVEEVFGLDVHDPQTKGWEITKLEVDKQWIKSRGEGVKIGVIDTGCDANHEDIKENIIGGYNFVQDNENFFDDNGHGSHVCGTICATDNGRGMVGVAPKSKIYSLKVMDANGNGKSKDIVKAIEFCIKYKLDIITMSLGAKNEMKDLTKIIEEANKKNILIFCAAGNSGINEDILYPARNKHTISIGAIDENFDRTPYTCSGDRLDFLSPGHNIMSILPNNRYGLMSGTSMSNPFAVGCASLYVSYLRQQKGTRLFSRQEIIDILKKNAINIPNSMYREKKYQGYGIIKPIL
jgi:major intracellular serine protease